MPRKILEGLLRDLRRDILSGYEVGSRYRSLEDLSATFTVSRKTAHKAVQRLVLEGLLTARPRAGIHVVSHEPRQSLTGKRLTILSDLHHRRAEESVERGVRDLAEPLGVGVTFLRNAERNTRSLRFGDYLLALDTDGVIAISFADAALGFYRAMREGLDLVADYDMPELPVLPVVQADFFKYAEKAGQILAEEGCTEAIAVGYPQLEESNCYQERFDGFRRGLRQAGDGVKYVCVSQPGAMAVLDQFFYDFAPPKAVFSLEFHANELVASLFAKHKIRREHARFLAFVGYEDIDQYPGLAPVPSVGPSLRQLGKGLADKMIDKWRNGRFREPLIELM